MTEKPKETEPVTEDTNYVKVPRDTVDQAERTIKDLQGEITIYRDTTNLYTKIIYGLIAACVVLLFLVINLALRKRDLKNEVKEYRSLGYTSSKQQKKAAKAASQAKAQQSKMQQPKAQQLRAGQSAPGPQQENVRMGDPAQNPPQNGGYPYPNRQQVYYDRAPINVTPQTSSRNMQPYPGQGPAAANGMAGNAPQQAVRPQQAEDAARAARQQAEAQAAKQQQAEEAARQQAEAQAQAAKQQQAEEAARAARQQAEAQAQAARQQQAEEAARMARQQAEAQAQTARQQNQPQAAGQSKSKRKKDVEINMVDL